MIYDCFMFFNELDLLDIRLHELSGVVDKFIISESHFTHAGNQKPLYYLENKERFSEFNDRIIHVADDEMLGPRFGGEWIRESAQRDIMWDTVIKDLNDDDLIMHLDLDEIPRASAVPHSLNSHEDIVGFRMILCEMYLNRRSYGTWSPAAVTSVRKLRTLEMCRFRFKTYRTDGVRFISNAGWHFSWMGGQEGIKIKAQATAHADLNVPEIWSEEHLAEVISGGKEVPFGIKGLSGGHDGHKFYIDNSGDLPRYVLDNYDEFKRKGFLI